MAKMDDKGPMQPPRKTSDVMKAAPQKAPGDPKKETTPDEPHTDAATSTVRPNQEDA